MPADVRRRYDERSGVREAMKPSNKCNGMTYDANLGLVVCEHATSSLIREYNGRREVLASHFDGKELNSPNDVCVRSDGSIYFSDPWYGGRLFTASNGRANWGFRASIVYRPSGSPQLLVDRNLFEQPNGLCFSPDERQLYVNETVRALIRVFDLNADGSLGPDRTSLPASAPNWSLGVPTGMKCDSAGNIWVTAPGGVWVYSRSGALIGKVKVPELVANLHWGKSDWRTLFMCAPHSLDAVCMCIGPHTEPFMRASTSASAGTASAAAAPERVAMHNGLARSFARCADHPGHAERRDRRRRRVRRLRLTAPRGRAERRRNCRRLADACRAAGSR